MLDLRQQSSICCRKDESLYIELFGLNADTFNLDLIVMGLLCRSGITCHMGVKSRLAFFLIFLQDVKHNNIVDNF